MPELKTTRRLSVYLATGQLVHFPDANAYALTGPDGRDLELLDRDWDNHVTRRSVAHFAAGGWIGVTWHDPSDNTEAIRIGFRLPASEVRSSQAV